MTADLTQVARLDDVERVARAIHDTEYQPCRDGYDDCQMADHYRRLAVAAIDVMRGDGAIGRALALAKQWADEAERRDQTAKRLPDQPAYRVEIHRLLVGARHQRRAARQLRAAVGAPTTAEGHDRG